MAIPGAISGLGYTFTTTSLDFTWDAASDADGYLATLYRDGNQVEQQDVTTEAAASFTGLEDGTAYTLDLHAYNVQGDGPVITGYDATTAYAIPSPPINLRQFEERIIAVICRWDLVEPAKTFDVQLQLLYGNELLFDEVIEPEQTERTFNVPMASTDYLLRVRAGNPAGWSEWAEGTITSETFPLIDSRLGVMAATYQEDALYTDTWDGASDQLKGIVEEMNAEADVSVGNYALVATFKPATVVSTSDSGSMMSPIVSLQGSERAIKQQYAAPKEKGALPKPYLSLSGDERLVKRQYALSPELGSMPNPSLSLSGVETKVNFNYYADDIGSMPKPSISISGTEVLV